MLGLLDGTPEMLLDPMIIPYRLGKFTLPMELIPLGDLEFFLINL